MFKSVRKSLKKQQDDSITSYSEEDSARSDSESEQDYEDVSEFDINEDKEVDNYVFIISVHEIVEEWKKYTKIKYKKKELESKKGKKNLKELMEHSMKKKVQVEKEEQEKRDP